MRADRLAGRDVGDRRVKDRPETPEGVGEDGVGITRRIVDQRTDRLDAALLGGVGRADALAEQDVGAGIDLGKARFARLRRIEEGADEGDEVLGSRD